MIVVLDIWLQEEHGPTQGSALVGGETKVVWEGCFEDGFKAWTLSEEEWNLISRPPQREGDFVAMTLLHHRLHKREPHCTFSHGEADWTKATGRHWGASQTS